MPSLSMIHSSLGDLVFIFLHRPAMFLPYHLRLQSNPLPFAFQMPRAARAESISVCHLSYHGIAKVLLRFDQLSTARQLLFAQFVSGC